MPRAGRITAAATTGPASGPRPASSTPATGARHSFSWRRPGISPPAPRTDRGRARAPSARVPRPAPARAPAPRAQAAAPARWRRAGEALRQPGGDRTGERAAGAVGVRRLRARIGPELRRSAPIEKDIRDLRPGHIPALRQHRHAEAACERAPQFRSCRVDRGTVRKRLQIAGHIRRHHRRHRHQPLERRDRVGIRQHRTRGRHHHRIEHDRHGERFEPVGHRVRRLRRSDHADLDRVDHRDRRPPRSICATTNSAGTGITPCTPSVFCAVSAVIAVASGDRRAW